MYVAFWLDPAAQDANKRVVFCQPFTKKPTTAWAILRSAVRENRTGGIIAGTDELLRTCIEAIDHKDDGWPDDADRMVGQITKLVESCGCTIVFRQNVEPDEVATHSAVWANLLAGTPRIDVESDLRSTVRVPLTGRPMDVVATIMAAKQAGWTVDEDVAFKCVGSTKISIQRFRMIETRAALEIEYAAASSMSKQNGAGYSQEVKFGFDKLADVLDTMLGPTAKRYKFVLLVKERTNSIMFFGTKPAHTLRQAIEQYVDHLQDRQSSDEPRSSQPPPKPDKNGKKPEPEPDLLEEVISPPVGSCRFWKL